jgi:hypothetical protein
MADAADAADDDWKDHKSIAIAEAAMLERFSLLANCAANGVSRRQFLGQVGRAAMAVAAAFAALLVVPTDVAAAPRVCGVGSAGYCLGKPQGATCRVGRYSGRCLAAPLCYCQINM